MYKLENEFLKVKFDGQGRLIHLENNKEGIGNVIDSPSEGSFRLIFKKDENWENVAFGKKQEYEIVKNENSIKFIVRQVKVRDFKADISVELNISLKGEDLVFDAKIDNNEKDALITDFDYPNIGAIKTLAGGRPALLWPKQSGEKYYNIGEYLAKMEPSREIVNQTLNMTYPGPGSMQWMALEDKNQILYLTSRDEDFYATELRVKGSSLDRGAITLIIDKMAFVEYEEKWEAPTSILKLYTGTWHYGGDDYKEWAKSWKPNYNPPKWVKDMMGYYLVINKQQYGHEMWKYDTLPYLYEQAVDTGCDVLGLFGWYDSGHDNEYPDLEVSESLGGAKMLKENIKKVQGEGGKVTLYFQGHLIDITTEFYKNGGHNYETKSRCGTPYYEQYNKAHNSSYLKNFTRKTFSTACPSCPEWQNLMKGKADFVASFGPDGVLYDQIGGIMPRPCFDNRHPHAKGKPSLSMSNGRIKLLDGIQKHTKDIDDEFAFFTEHITDIYSVHTDCLHGIGAYPSKEGNRLLNNIDSDKAFVINFPELFRYCFPEIIITVRNPYPYISPRVANYAFVFGFRYEMEIRYLADCEDILSNKHAKYNEYAKKVTELRKKYWDILAYGQFADEDYIENKSKAIIAKVYSKDNKIVVAMWNDTDKEAAVDFSVRDYKFVEATTVEETTKKQIETLPPQGIAILLYEK